MRASITIQTLTNPNVIILGTQIITAFSAGFTIGSQTLTPGGTITYSGNTLTLESSGEVIVHSSDYSATLTLTTSLRENHSGPQESSLLAKLRPLFRYRLHNGGHGKHLDTVIHQAHVHWLPMADLHW